MSVHQDSEKNPTRCNLTIYELVFTVNRLTYRRFSCIFESLRLCLLTLSGLSGVFGFDVSEDFSIVTRGKKSIFGALYLIFFCPSYTITSKLGVSASLLTVSSGELKVF